MDEAFSALDPVIRYDMQAQLRELQARLHQDHRLHHPRPSTKRFSWATTVAILKDGELRRIGTGSEILLQPATTTSSASCGTSTGRASWTFGSVAETARPDRDIDIPERRN